MPEYHSNDGGQRRSRRGGRNRNFRPGRSEENRGPSKSAQAQPSGFQRFLSAISFGLLGKSAPAPKSRPQATPPARRQETASGQPRSERKPSEPRPPRPAPTSAEVTTDRLYVGNLSYDATESDLFELFNGVGKVQNAEVVVNSRTQRSKGFAFVTMASVDEAKRAVVELHGKDFMGRPLQLSGAKPMAARGDREEPSAEEVAPAPEANAA
ncbi:MAG: hypothetical protein JNJ83_21950 [Verrucomicrobiaceae bacterium]|nr:hypothetical protein [Verrucomicrobiaceae bacterium]